MKKTVLFIVIMIVVISACNNPQKNLTPRSKTLINLDEIAETISTETVPVKVIYNNPPVHMGIMRKKNEAIEIFNLLAGPDSTLFVWDYDFRRIMHLDQNGRLIRFIEGPKTGPGKFDQLLPCIAQSANLIYIPAFPNSIQVYDLGLNYLRTVKNTLIYTYEFAVGKDGVILGMPEVAGKYCGIKPDTITAAGTRPTLDAKLLYLATVHDGVDREKGGFGAVVAEDSLVFSYARRLPYYIVADEKSDYIWFVFRFYPAVRKYDYHGNFLEEITFTSKAIEKGRKWAGYLPKRHEAVSGVVFFQNPHLLDNGDLFVNMPAHGYMRFSGAKAGMQVVKKYELDRVAELEDQRTAFVQWLHGKIYAYVPQGIILKENR